MFSVLAHICGYKHHGQAQSDHAIWKSKAEEAVARAEQAEAAQAELAAKLEVPLPMHAKGETAAISPVCWLCLSERGSIPLLFQHTGVLKKVSALGNR